MTEDLLKRIAERSEQEIKIGPIWSRVDHEHCLALIAEVRRLRAALKRYSRHDGGPDGCARSCDGYEDFCALCTCGLDEALKGSPSPHG